MNATFNSEKPPTPKHFQFFWGMLVLYTIYFISGFTALLYQVVWQRMLGLFSGSDVRSVTIVVASYLLGLGIGSLLGGFLSERLSSRQAIQLYGCCNLGIAVFAVFSRFLFYDLLFLQWQPLAQSMVLTLSIVFVSLLIPTALMGVSLPLVSKATSHHAAKAASRIGILYGVNTLGSALGTLLSGWYIVGTLGYEGTVYLGAALSVAVGLVALLSAYQFEVDARFGATVALSWQSIPRPVLYWCILVFFSGFLAISLEIIWFRVLDTILQSIAYTYAHLLAFILASNALGSMAGAVAIRYIRQPRQVFLLIQGSVVAYSLMAIWLIGSYWQSHPTNLHVELGYIDPNNINASVIFKYVILPSIMLVPPNLLLGFYFPLVQKAVQTDDRQIGQRVGIIQVANILGNTTGSLLTGLVLLDRWGTAGSLRLLAFLGLGFVLILRPNLTKRKLTMVFAIALTVIAVLFPNNTRLWANLHGIKPQQYFIAAEDSTGVAAVTEVNRQGTLLASGQAQAGFPYMNVHAVLGTLPALIHPHPTEVMIIGLGSGGTAHTAGVNSLSQHIRVVELLGAELTILRKYAMNSIGQPLKFLFQDPRYEFIIGDGRRELALAERQFDIIEADAIYPWRSRAGMLYSSEFFEEVRSHLAPGGLFVEWNVGFGTEETFRSVFPYVIELAMSGDLHILIGSDRLVDFDREDLLDKLKNPRVLTFLGDAKVNVEAIRQDVRSASVRSYWQVKDGRPEPVNTDLFPRSEYYLNQPEFNKVRT